MADSNRKWWALAAVGSGVFMSTIDGSIVNIALKTLQETFQTGLNTVEWVVLSYLLTITALLLSMGRLGDMIGKRRVYLAGFIIFTVGSALCSLAWDITSLIGFRVVQGVGAAMIQSMGAALLVSAFPAKERGQALGYIGSIVAAGISVGPALGGILIRSFGWPSIFYVNIPVGILAIIISLYALPNDRQRTTQRFDIPGAGFLAVSLLLILLALTEGQYWGWSDWRILAFFAFGIVGLFLFVWWERRTEAPMINLSIFSNWTFSASLLSSLGAFLALSFNLFLIPFYLQNVLGFDPQQAGFVLIATPLALSLTSPISGRLSDRFGTRWLAILGLIVSALGLFSMTTLTTESTAVGVFGRLLFIGAGVGFFQSPNNSAVMGNAPRSALGIAGSLISIMRTIGQTGGIALAGAVWAARVTTAAGETYDPINAAPPEALVAGLHDAMLLAAGLCLVAIVPTWLRSQRADQDMIAERSTP